MNFCRMKRSGRIWVWAAGASLAVITLAALAAYHYRNRDQFNADDALVKELQSSSLPPAEITPNQTEWPQWRGPRRDGISHETGLRTDWPADGLPIIWQAKIGPGYSSIAVAGGRVVTMFQDGDNEVVICWNAAGQEKWRFPYPAKYNTDRSYGPWPRSTPTIDGKRVYTLGAAGTLLCIDLESGKEIWRHELRTEFNAPQPRWGFAESPLVEGGRVFVNPGGPKGQSLAAFDKESGTLIWKALEDPTGYSSMISTSAAGVPQLLCFTGNALVGIASADGKLYWRYPWNTNYECNIATPIVRGDYVFISSGYGKGCALVKIEKDGSGNLQAREVYRTTRMRNHYATSVLLGEHLYGFDDPGLLTCLEFRTGKVVWRERAYGKGSLIGVGGNLVVLSEDGKLALVEATPAGLRQRSAFKFSDSRCWAPPALAEGRLYVRDDQKLVCYDLRKP